MPAVISIVPSPSEACAELTAIALAAKRHWAYPEDLMARWRHDLTMTPEKMEEHLVYHAERAGRVAGFYRLRIDGANAELEDMWVAPDHMGLSVGRALFEHAMGEAGRAGADELVVVGDPHAVGFYVAMGAVRVGETPSEPSPRRLPVLILRLTSRSAGPP